MKVLFENNGFKIISTEDFSKLPDIKLHILTVDTLKEKMIYKSTSLAKLMQIASKWENEPSFIDIEYHTYTCKDTLEYSDENGEYCGINSFKGILV